MTCFFIILFNQDLYYCEIIVPTHPTENLATAVGWVGLEHFNKMTFAF